MMRENKWGDILYYIMMRKNKWWRSFILSYDEIEEAGEIFYIIL